MKLISCVVVALAALFAGTQQPRYAVIRTSNVVQLEDRTSQTKVSVIPSVGNVAFEMSVKGQQVLRFPYASVDEFKKAPRLSGIPLLAPWANRLDELGFYANGTHYTFNMDLGNVRGPRPIHGLLAAAAGWQVIEERGDSESARVTSRLDFYRQPAWMAQFPFAHTITMTYRLQEGVLEVATRIDNLSADPMPVAVGFHPYFQLTDSPRNDWTVSIGARTQWLLSSDKLPTGETRPIDQMFPNPAQIAVRDFNLDDVFGDLVRDAAGRAVMSVKGRSQRLDVAFGANYRAVVIYSPPVAAGAAQTQGFICFEPMAGITNALNLAHRGTYKELQSIPPGGVWQESFWIRPSGF